MKKGLIIAAVVLIALGAGVFMMRSRQNTNSANTDGTSQTTEPTEASTNSTPTSTESSVTKVSIKGFAYSPTTLAVKKGTTVTWTNEDTATHTVTSDSGSELQSKSLSKGDTFSHTFSASGTFDYHCAPHPSMKASIIVTE